MCQRPSEETASGMRKVGVARGPSAMVDAGGVGGVGAFSALASVDRGAGDGGGGDGGGGGHLSPS